MYVYVRAGKIWLKSETKIRAPGCQEYQTDHKPTDRIIYEDAQIKLYEQSRQYAEDTNRYRLQKELNNEKRKNEELTRIANTKVEKELELEVKKQKPNEYQRKIYLLRNMRGLQQS